MKTLVKYSQYFTITDINFAKLIYQLQGFNKNLVTYTMAMEQKGRWKSRDVITKVDKILYIIESENPESSKSKDVIRYPITLLDRLLDYLSVNNLDTDLTIINKSPIESNTIEILPDMLRKPRDYQTVYINGILGWTKHNLLVDLLMGYGKAVSHTTPIRTLTGWTLINDLLVGDKVIGRDGLETNVTGIYPQGKRQLYCVTFEDGRKQDVDLEHLWSVYIKDSLLPTVVNTDFIRKRKTIKFEIDLVIPQDCEDKGYVISPFDLGQILTTCKSVSNNIKKLKPKVYDELDNLGLLNNIPRIPEQYLNGSIKQREALLKGIICDMGFIKDGDLFLKTRYRLLLKDMQELIWGLGGKSEQTSPTFITVRLPKLREFILLPSLLIEFKEKPFTTRLKIHSIRKSIKDEAICISVDNEDKLYVLKDYVVTHNTFIAMYSLSQLKKRFAIVVLPRYIDKWIGDVLSLTNIKRDEIFVVKGLTMLIDIIMYPDKYSSFKTFIFSLTTINLFIKSYLTNDLVASLGLSPEMIMESINIDVVLNDETHKEFYNVYKLMLFSNHRLTIGLTATLEHNDEHIENMYKIGFPMENRISNVIKYKKYIEIYSLQYKFRNKRLINFKSAFGYNQATFEQSIMRQTYILNNYLKMIHSISNSLYFNRRKDKQKLLIFAGTVKMCKHGVAYFKKLHPDLVIASYTEEDDYEIIDKTDVIFSTLQSLGTAIDIDNLITVINPFNTGSKQSDLQAAGRLRDLPEATMKYCYLWSSDISSHSKYTIARKKLFYRLAKFSKNILYKHQI